MSTTTLQCESIDILNQQFADAIDLRHQAMQARWGAKRSNCLSLSRTFDQVGHHIERFIDLIAERVLDLGGVSIESIQTAAEGSRLPAYPREIMLGLHHARALSIALAIFALRIRSRSDVARSYGDVITASLLTHAWRGLEPVIWRVDSLVHAEG